MKNLLMLLTLLTSASSFASPSYSNDSDINVKIKSAGTGIYITEMSSVSNSVDSCDKSLNEYVAELDSKGAILGKVEKCKEHSEVHCRVKFGHSCDELVETITTKGSVSFIYLKD